MKKALERIISACAGFWQLDEKDKPDPRISEWVGGLSALVEIEICELAGWDVVLQTSVEATISLTE